MSHEFYRRNLPHFVPAGGTFFVTFRLADSLPRDVLERWEAEDVRLAALTADMPPAAAAVERREAGKHRFREAERHLDGATSGPMWLREECVAAVVAGAFEWLEEQKAQVEAWCIMPNHVHVLLTPRARADERSPPLASIMQSLKGYTAWRANRLLGRTGPFWQHESYDHWVRNEREFEKIARYILWNPVKAGLVTQPEEWRWSYCRFGP